MLLTLKPFYAAVGSTLSGFDPYYDNVTLLLHAEGSNGSSIITDEKGHTATLGTGVTLSTATSMFGNSSMLFNNTASATLNFNGSSDFAFGYDDFTIEMFVKTNAIGVIQTIYDARPPNTNGAYPYLDIGTTGALSWYANGAYQIVSPTKFVANTWYHIAISRTNSVISMFINGVLQGKYTDAGNYLNGANRPVVGSNGYTFGSYQVNGYLDEVRITKGVGRYIASVPGTSFSTDANTKLLAHFENNVTEAVGSTLTNNGVTFVTSPAKTGAYSAYFNGASYVTTPYVKSLFDWYASDFTIEAWVCASSWAGWSYVDGATTKSALIANASLTAPSDYWSFGPIASGAVTFYYWSGSVNSITTTATLSLNTWHHIALVKSGSTVTIYIDGIASATASIAGTPLSGTENPLVIGKHNNIALTGYVDELRLSNVARYTSNFASVPAPQSASLSTCESSFDPYYNNNVLLIHGNETASLDTTFVDSSISQAAITRYGNVRQGVKNPFGTTADGSIYFDAAPSSVTAPASSAVVGTGDFTVDLWLYPITIASGYRVIFANDTSSGFVSTVNSTGTISFGRSLVAIDGTTTNAVNFNAWNHIAFSRTAGVLKIFINGVQGYSASNTTSFAAGLVRIGTDGGGSAFPINAYISNFRTLAGIGIYTAGFTPPTSAPAVVQNTVLLLNTKNSGYVSANTQTIDYSANSIPLTNAGSTSLVPASPFGLLGQSLSFNGSSQKLTTAATAGIAFGTGDFTVEFWLYPLSFANYITYVSTRTGVNTSSWSIGTQAAGQILFYAGSELIRSSATLTRNAWQHIAIVRKNGVLSGYINGVKYAADVSNNYNFTANVAAIGGDTVFGELAPAYMSNVRITNTAVYSAAFTPSTTPLTAITGTQLLVACKPYTFLNNTAIAEMGTGYPVTVSGASVNSAVSPFAAQGSSLLFTGATPDYLKMTVPAAAGFGTGDYTVEYWAFPTSYSATVNVLTDYRGSQTGVYFSDSISTAGKYQMYNVATATTYYTSTSIIPLNTWTHIAAVRTNGVLRVYINGVLDGQQADTQNWVIPAVANNVFVGVSNWSGQITAAFAFSGYLNVRHVKGSALYSGISFALPTTPFTAVAGTSLLLKGDTPFVIDSMRKASLLPAGTVTVSNAKSRQGSTSLYFDGSASSSITCKSPCAASPFVGNFTVEMWFYCTGSTTSYSGLFDSRNGSTTTGLAIYYLATSYQLGLNSAGTTYITPSAATAFAINQWNHIALTRSNGYLFLWLNGKLIGSAAAGTITDNVNWNIGKVDSNYAIGYIDEFRVTAGIARYIAPFSPKQQSAFSEAGPSYEPYVRMNQLVINGGTATAYDVTLADSSPNHAYLSSPTPARQGLKNPFGTDTDGSLYFNGSTYLMGTNPKNALGTSDFTIEFWMNPTTIPSGYADLVNFNGVMLGMYSSGFLTLYKFNGVASPIQTTFNVPANTWTHVALVRIGSTLTLYANGQSVITSTASSSLDLPLYIGCWTTTTTEFYSGYLSNLRIVRGTAIYTSNFTVPASALTAVTGTIVLLNTKSNGYQTNNSLFLDYSPNNSPMGNIGSASMHPASPFGSRGMSVSLNGTSQYAYTAQTTLDLAAADFTIECWINVRTIAPAYQVVLSKSFNDPAGQGPFVLQLMGNQLKFWAASVGAPASTWNLINGATVGTIASYTWYHVAIVRSGSTVTYYLNGVSAGTSNVGTAALYQTSYAVVVGAVQYNSGFTSYLNGHVSNVRILKGTALYTGNFTVPTSNLTNIANTQLLLLCKPFSVLNNMAYIENSGNNFPVTAGGTPTLTSKSPFSTGGYSAHFGGAGYLTAGSTPSATIGSADFTAEAWFNVSTFGTAGTVRGYVLGMPSTSYFPLGIATYVDSSGRNILQCWMSSTGSTWDMISGVGQDSSQITTVGSNLMTNVWYHVAVVRNGNTFTSYLNGVQQVTWTKSTALMAPTQPGYVVGGIGNANNYLVGYVSNARLVKGTALYTSTFTPSTSPLTAVAGTQVLFNFDNAGVVDTVNKRAVALLGTVQPTNVVAKFESSLQFNGAAGDYVSIPDFRYLDFGTSDFTIELWVYPTQNTTATSLLTKRNNNISSIGLWTAAGSSQVTWYGTSNSTSWDIASNVNVGTMILNQWNHVVLVRSGGAFIPFMNGAMGTVVYSTASIIANTNAMYIGNDTGSGGAFKGYIDEVRIATGVARYLSNFKLPSETYALTDTSNTAYDPYEQNVVFALAGSISDLKQHAVTVTGSPLVSTSIAKFNSTSVYFNGSNTKLTYAASIDWYLGDTFTIDFWAHPLALPASGNILRLMLIGTNATASALQLSITNTGSIFLGVPNGAITGVTTGDGAFELNKWNHYAVCVLGGFARIYKNGIDISTNYISGTGNIAAVSAITLQAALATNTMTLGYDTVATVNAQYNGYLQDFRITKGICRYTANFVPPAASNPTYGLDA